MSSQLDAFDSTPPRFPRARTTDARSSHEAAALIESTGRARTDAMRVLRAVRRWPNSTTAELAKFARIDRYTVARRMPELHEAHLVARYEPTPITAPCAVSGKRVIRWSPQ